MFGYLQRYGFTDFRTGQTEQKRCNVIKAIIVVSLIFSYETCGKPSFCFWKVGCFLVLWRHSTKVFMIHSNNKIIILIFLQYFFPVHVFWDFQYIYSAKRPIINCVSLVTEYWRLFFIKWMYTCPREITLMWKYISLFL